MNAIVQARRPALVGRLNERSRQYRDPLSQIPWDDLDPEAFWLPESLISLHGLPVYQSLSEIQRRMLSQCEFLAFTELGLWLEALFIQRISRNVLDIADKSLDRYEYELHELREEVGHSLMFLTFIRKSGIPLLTPFRDRPRMAGLFARFAPYRSAAFWTTILIGEEVPDQMNRLIRRQGDLPGAVLGMTHLHMREEARHMAYARELLSERLPRLNRLQRALLRPLLRRVIHEFIETCFYPSAQVYAAAGLDNPDKLVRVARRNPARHALIQRCTAPSLAFLRQHDINI
ncbi:diiron oxygenase [Thermithiobacillus plumbiphilus]|uniref:Diiron oxygenase n=1 Tax=Thermithiobacillus plumbiphilus TaxID=1729899 RepID=A0ABU9D5F0_9PROT